MGDERLSYKRQVSKKIKNLVAHHFILVSHPFGIEDGISLDDDSIVLLNHDVDKEAIH